MTLRESGNFHYKNRNFTKAIEYYLKSIESNPNEAPVFYNLGMSQFQLQRFEECLKSCTEALRLEPKYKKAFYRQMFAYGKLGRYLEAVVAGQRFLELEDPKE